MGLIKSWLNKPAITPAISRLDYPDVPKVRPQNDLQTYVDIVRTAQNQLSNIEYGLVLGLFYT